jgi:ribonuclease P protein component
LGVVDLVTLKRRADFLRVRGGPKWSGPAFLMDTRPSLQPGPPRIGFTVTKKLGNAVVRNRIRRRLREAVRAGLTAGAQPNHDYVVVARPPAIDRPFQDLVRDVEAAFRRLHKPPPVAKAPSA